MTKLLWYTFPMRDRVFMVHRWGGRPDDVWFPWLKSECKKAGIHAEAPTMPNADEPEIGTWVYHLQHVVGEPDDRTFFVGHSIGCQTILRYLEGLPEGTTVGGVVVVAGFLTLISGLSPEEQIIAKPWLETPLDYAKIRQRAKRFVAIFSDNDPYVPLENKPLFEKHLGAQTIVEHGRGHFSSTDNITELPDVFAALLRMLQTP